MSVMTTHLETPVFGWNVLYVDDVAASLEFFTNGCGLSTRFVHEGGDYAELDTGPTALALCNRTLATDSIGVTLTSESNNSANLTLFCGDVAARWQWAIDHGAVALNAPATKPWGQVTAYVRSPDGHIVEFATPMG
jgi:lactoylglutathione lyase